MKLEGTGTLLRIFIGESDRWHGKPLYEAIVLGAREHGLAGATVLRGPMGYGASSLIHTAKIVRLSADLPMVIEIVDTDAKIQRFLTVLDGMVTEGMITLEKVQIVRYKGRETAD
jgi:PII-like signaling protein